MVALEEKYKLIAQFFQTRKLQILRISNSRIDFDSICNASSHKSEGGPFRYELYLSNDKRDRPAPLAYILLHKLGHILQNECTHDTMRITESFCQMSDELFDYGMQGISIFRQTAINKAGRMLDFMACYCYNNLVSRWAAMSY